jgi:uncharacterized protein (TIGR00251 family)
MPLDPTAIEIVEHVGHIELAIKVVPGASRSKIAGNWGTALKVAVSAPPEGGKANAALIKLLAKSLGVKRASVTIISGQTQPVKRVAIANTTVGEVRRRLAAN